MYYKIIYLVAQKIQRPGQRLRRTRHLRDEQERLYVHRNAEGDERRRREIRSRGWRLELRPRRGVIYTPKRRPALRPEICSLVGQKGRKLAGAVPGRRKRQCRRKYEIQLRL